MKNRSKRTIKQDRKRILYRVARKMTEIVPLDLNHNIFVSNHEAYHLTKEEGKIARDRLSRLQPFSLKAAERIVQESYLPSFVAKHEDICQHLGSLHLAYELLARHLINLADEEKDIEKKVANAFAKKRQIPFSDALEKVKYSHLLQLMVEVPDYVKHFSWEYWAEQI